MQPVSISKAFGGEAYECKSGSSGFKPLSAGVSASRARAAAFRGTLGLGTKTELDRASKVLPMHRALRAAAPTRPQGVLRNSTSFCMSSEKGAEARSVDTCECSSSLTVAREI